AIAVNQARCAKVRNRNVECLKCAQACTSGCISLIDGELVIDSSKCVGCGTCATVCPTCALEARNPSDAELLNACLAARCDDSVEICCSQLAAALDGLIDKEKYAQVVCPAALTRRLFTSLPHAA
ncbi:MAG: 4Fe-4S binding protein, partial [Slackia sp.]